MLNGAPVMQAGLNLGVQTPESWSCKEKGGEGSDLDESAWGLSWPGKEEQWFTKDRLTPSLWSKILLGQTYIHDQRMNLEQGERPSWEWMGM